MMVRGIGELELVRALVPDWLAVVFAVLTQLGDLWFLVPVLGGCYWLCRDRQDDIAAVGGLSLAGVGLYRGFKEVFALPRPDQQPLEPESLPWLLQSVWDVSTMVSGFGFPSGHATSATLVYVGLACVLTLGTRRRRLVAAGLLAGTVSVTRVVLGVHFLVDVVAGFGLALCVLVVGLRGFANRRVGRPTLAFAFAVSTGLFYLLAAGGEFYSVVLLGASVGAFGGWQGVLFVRTLLGTGPSPTVRSPPIVHGGLFAAALASLLLVLLVSPVVWAPASAVAGVTGLAVGVAVLVPAVRRSDRLGHVLTALRLWL